VAGALACCSNNGAAAAAAAELLPTTAIYTLGDKPNAERPRNEDKYFLLQGDGWNSCIWEETQEKEGRYINLGSIYGAFKNFLSVLPSPRERKHP